MCVVALPLKAPSSPAIFSTGGFALSSVTVPGPRYFDTVIVAGGRGVLIGALVPLVYFMSSAAQMSSANGEEIDAVRVGADARSASGPWMPFPAGSKRITGGVFPTAISLNGLMT